MTIEIELGPCKPQPTVNRTVVRLSTSCWKDKRGIHCRTSLIGLKKLSIGYQLLTEDADNIGADKVTDNIINLRQSPDGIYEVVMVNEWRDHETGHVEDWDYKLIPFKP